MDETIETTEMDAMDNIEESEEYTEEGGFPVIPAAIGGVIIAGAAALVANRKKLAAKIAEKRYEHALKVKEDYGRTTRSKTTGFRKGLSQLYTGSSLFALEEIYE